MNMDKLTAMLSDATVMTDLLSCKSMEELLEKLNKNGAGCTAEEAVKFAKSLKKTLTKTDAMDMDAMDQVAGGTGEITYDDLFGGDAPFETYMIPSGLQDPMAPVSAVGGKHDLFRPLTNDEILMTARSLLNDEEYQHLLDEMEAHKDMRF